MKNTVINFLERVKQSRGRRRRAAAILVCLSLIVAGGTTWALHMKGESQTGKTYCGYEEHRHDDSCVEKTLVCGYDTEEATEEASSHTHTDECYETRTVLTCTMDVHQHSEDGGCYDEDGNLICEIPEHTHSEEAGCYTEESVLVCGKEEGSAESAESQTEVSAHVHTDECYEITYTCGYDYEHTHTLSCFSNPEADAETADVWEKTVSDVELTGDFATDLVAVAKTQLGYEESADNYQVALDDEGNETTETMGYTRYGAWYGDAYGDWDAMFASFCLNYAGITSEMMPYEASCPDWAENLSRLGFYEPALAETPDGDGGAAAARNDYTPETGDLIFFDGDGDGSANHVGIVEELEIRETADDEGAVSYEYVVHTIEGDDSGKVTRRKYDLEDEEILGYGSIYSVYLAAVDDGLIENVRRLTAETEDGMTFSAIGEIPDGAALEVSPLTGEQNAYLAENGLTGDFCDIKILVDGEKYQPDTPVQISISGLGYDVSTVLEGFHLAVDAEDLMDSEDFETLSVDVRNTGNRIAFEADSFSIYGVGELAADDYDYAQTEPTAVDSLTVKLKTMTYNTNTKYYDQGDANGASGEALESNGTYACYQNTESGSNYYLIPVDYLSAKYKNSGFVFSETQTCPFVYLTNSDTLDWTKASVGSYEKYGENYYLKVKCASGSTPVICYTILNEATDTVTPSSTSIHMFDYWTTENRLDSDNHISNTADMTRGINKNHVLKFGKNMGNTQGDLNYSYGGTGTPSKVTAGIVENTLGKDGYPILTNNSTLGTNGEPLSYLFNPNEEVDGKESFTRVTGLLSVDAQGYFYYNSAERFAQLNEDTKAFTVYEQPAGKNTSLGTLTNQADVKYGQFYPFNDGHQVALLTNDQNPINHYFGMTLTTRFIQNNDGYTTALKNTHTTFEFSGDNDVWIFIDDVLVADLGGLSSARSVTIDFVTGDVTINDGTNDNPSTTLKNAFIAAEKESSEKWNGNTFVDNTTHTLKFYYLERGNYDSNLMLKYNLTDIPTTAIYKVNQYNEALSGATFAVYASDKNGNYYSDLESEGGTIVTLPSDIKYDNDWNIVDSDGNVLVKALYYGTTDDIGQMIFTDENEMPYSISELQKMFGSYFLLREVDVPEGYRTVSDDVLMNIDTDVGILQTAESSYSTGVWSSPNMLTTATNTLYLANVNDSGKVGAGEDGTITYYTLSDDGKSWNTKGSLFAVVLYKGTQIGGFDTWTPVKGNDVEGYDYVRNEGSGSYSNVDDAKEAAKSYGTSHVFSYSASGMQALIEELPGEITDYYTVLEYEGTTGDVGDAKYLVAYYYTTEDIATNGWGGVNSKNTARVLSHDSTTPGATNTGGFTVQWGATIEVPNTVNALYFQKADSDGDLLDNAVFALYEAATDSTNKGYYVGTGSDGSTVYIRLDENAEKSVAYGSAAVYDANFENAVTGTYTIQSGSTQSGGYITDSGAGTITVTVSTTTGEETTANYTITPATNASTGGSQSLVGYTHDTCATSSEKGTGHFQYLNVGKYFLKEVQAPNGYSMAYQNTPVEVTNETVYANAGDEDNGVRVGNGVGYLVRTMDVFASLESIDETLSWVYTHLKVVTQEDSEFHDDLDNAFYTYGDYSNDSEFKVGESNGKGTTYIPEGALTDDTHLIDGPYTPPVDGAMTQYLRYEGDLTETTDKGSVFDYALYGRTDSEGNAQGAQSYRLWTESGWSDLAVFQDYAYGSANKTEYTEYTNLSKLEIGEISYLFSSSTFVQVTDAVDVDLTVTKVTTDFEDGSGNTATAYLDGAEFYLKEESSGLYYSYDAEHDKTSWVNKSEATKLTTKTYFTYKKNGTTTTEEITTSVSVENNIVTKTYTINGTKYTLTNYEDTGAATFTEVNGTGTLTGTLRRSFFKVYNLTEGTYTLTEVTAPTYSYTVGGATTDEKFILNDTNSTTEITLASGSYWYYITTGTGNTIIVPQDDIKTTETVNEQIIPKTFLYRTENGETVEATVTDTSTKTDDGGYTFTFTYDGKEITNTLYLNDESGFTLEVDGAAATRVFKVDSTGTTAAYYDSATTAYQGGFRVMNTSEVSEESLTLVKVDKNADESETNYTAGYNTEKTQFTVTGTDDKLSTHNVLAGAKFYLYYKSTDENTRENYYYSIDDKGVVQWSTSLEKADEVAVDKDGSLTFRALNKSNTYYLVECQAPDGYNLLTEELEVSWDDSTGALTVVGATSGETYHLETVTTTDADGEGTTVTYLVVYNASGYSLPKTGGTGTYLFTLGGIAILAVVTLVYGCGLRRRRERRAE